MGVHDKNPDDGMNPKDRVGRRKVPLHLIPPAALIEEALALQTGADKYGPYNWRQKEITATIYVSAALRHLQQYLDGEDIDPESDCSHLAHARAGLGILIDAISLGLVDDDRPAKGRAGELLRAATRKEPP